MTETPEQSEEKRRQQWRQDADDLANEMAGIATGGMPRFLSQEEFERRAALRKGEDPDRPSLQRLLQMVYQETYERVMQDLDFQMRAADMALDDINREMAENRRERQRMLDKAYKLPDGRRAFRTADGKAAYDEHGVKLEESEFSKIPQREFDGRPS